MDYNNYWPSLEVASCSGQHTHRNCFTSETARDALVTLIAPFGAAKPMALVASVKSVAVLVFLLLACTVASAERCIVNGPRYNLAADVVAWSMKVESGRRCIRGLRYANVELEELALVSPPQSGKAALVGWDVSYAPDDGFQGLDQFVVTVSGKIKKKRGTSTIHVLVSVIQSQANAAAQPQLSAP
jgi:hypothetical protein